MINFRYCGNKLPPPMSSSSNIMSIVFYSDDTTSAPGFSAAYTAIDAKKGL